MLHSGMLKVTTPSDREIAMTREFDAPRSLVFEAWTKPELLKQWLGVQEGWSLATCEIDLRVGGASRYLWRGPDGAEMGMRGIYKEIAPPERVVTTELYDQAWYPGDAVGTLMLVEKAGKTTLTLTVQYNSKDTRDMVLKSPATEGVSAGFDKLAEVLASRSEGGAR